MLLLQAAAPGGTALTVMAISLAVIALCFVGITAALVFAARTAGKEIRELSTILEGLRSELSPALKAVQSVSAEGERLAQLISGEAEALVDSSRALREGLEERFANLQAVYEVVEAEVEETALDVAVKLRTFRSGVGWFSTIRRLLRAGRGR